MALWIAGYFVVLLLCFYVLGRYTPEHGNWFGYVAIVLALPVLLPCGLVLLAGAIILLPCATMTYVGDLLRQQHQPRRQQH